MNAVLSANVAFRLRAGRSETIVRPRYGSVTGGILIVLGLLTSARALSLVRTSSTLAPGGTALSPLLAAVVWTLLALALGIVGYWFLVGVTVLSLSDADVSVSWKAPLAPYIRQTKLPLDLVGEIWVERYTVKHRGGHRPFWKLVADHGGTPTTLLSGLTMEDGERILEGPLRQLAMRGAARRRERINDAPATPHDR